MTLLHELRFSARTLLKSPLFTATALVSLAIGLGSTTTVFTLVNTFFLSPVPGVDDPGELVTVGRQGQRGDRAPRFSYLDYRDLRDAQEVFSGLAAYTDRGFNLDAGGETRLVVGQVVSGNYFSVYGVEAAAGRLLGPGDDVTPGAHPVAVLSHRLWRRHFGSDPAVVGSTVRLNGAPYTVVGITEEGFDGTFLGFSFGVYVPLAMAEVAVPGLRLEDRDLDLVELGGRLRDGVDHREARAHLEVLSRRLDDAYRGDRTPYELEVLPYTGFDEEIRSAVVVFVAVLLAVALLVLAIACVNVANMLLVRSATRFKEIAVRLALGAGRRRLAGQLLAESSLLAVTGGALGLLVAVWSVDLLRTFDPTAGTAVPLVLDFRLDLRVVLFAFFLSLVSGLAFGLAPALQASRPDLVPALTDAAPRGSHKSFLRSLFVAGQIALTLVLLIAAGLFLRVLGKAAAGDPGFRTEGVLVATVDTSLRTFEGPAERADFYRRLAEHVGDAAGAQGVTLAGRIPRTTGRSRAEVTFDGPRPPAGEDPWRIAFTTVDPSYFDVLEIPIVRGRSFHRTDDHGAPAVAIVSEALARRHWPGTDALGRRLYRDGRPLEVIGVARDVQGSAFDEAPRPFLYLPIAQAPPTRTTLMARSAEPGWGATLRREIRTFDADLPILAVTSLADALRVALLPQRVAGGAAGVLGAIALLLAAVGIHGVVAYSASQRTREFGLRISVGARERDISRLVLGQGLRLIGLGVGLGLAASLALTGLLESLLVGVSPTDPATFGAIAVLLVGTTLLASYFPARRAARADPVRSLRSE